MGGRVVEMLPSMCHWDSVFRTEVLVSSLGDQCLSGLALCQSYSPFGDSRFQGLVIQGHKGLVSFCQFRTALPGTWPQCSLWGQPKASLGLQLCLLFLPSFISFTSSKGGDLRSLSNKPPIHQSIITRSASWETWAIKCRPPLFRSSGQLFGRLANPGHWRNCQELSRGSSQGYLIMDTWLISSQSFDKVFSPSLLYLPHRLVFPPGLHLLYEPAAREFVFKQNISQDIMLMLTLWDTSSAGDT